MPPDVPILTLKTVGSVAVMFNPFHPGHSGRVEHDSSELHRNSESSPAAKSSIKLAVYNYISSGYIGYSFIIHECDIIFISYMSLRQSRG